MDCWWLLVDEGDAACKSNGFWISWPLGPARGVKSLGVEGQNLSILAAIDGIVEVDDDGSGLRVGVSLAVMVLLLEGIDGVLVSFIVVAVAGVGDTGDEDDGGMDLERVRR